MTLSARRVLSRARVSLEFFEWAGRRSFRDAWMECPRGDWLLRLAAALRIDRPVLVRATIACVHPSLARARPGRGPWGRAMKVALAWCDGRATIVEAHRAAHEASTAVGVAQTLTSAAWATDAAWSSTATVDHASWAEVAVSQAAESAASAAPPGSKDEARAAFLLGAAETVRRIIPYDLAAGPARALKLYP